MTAYAQSQSIPSLDQNILKPGNPNRLVLFLLYDSRVATQKESIQFMEMKSILPWMIENS